MPLTKFKSVCVLSLLVLTSWMASRTFVGTSIVHALIGGNQREVAVVPTEGSSDVLTVTAAFVGTTPTATPTLTPTVTPTATPPIVPVIIGTNVEQLTYSVDFQNYNATSTFYWMPGSSHTIGVVSPQSFGSSTRYVWSRWSNDGPISQSVSVQSPETFTANFKQQHLLTMCCNFPPEYGSVLPSTGFFDAGTTVLISAQPNPMRPAFFIDWQGFGSGSYSGRNNPASVIMHGPISQTAQFGYVENPTGTPTNTPTATPTAVPTPIYVTVRTNVAGLAYTVDSETYTISQSFAWTVGSSHSISIDASLQGSSSSRYVWTNWSDGGSQQHTITATSSATYTANFKTQYYLNICCNSQNWSVSPPADFYDSGSTVQIQAVSNPGSGYNFWFWDGRGLGSYSGADNTATITMRGPVYQFARFLQGTPTPLRKAPFDYDGDVKTDISVYRPSNGRWFIEGSRDGEYIWQLGNATDKIVPADYDGEGKADLAVYRPSQGVWYQYNSGSGTYLATQFGLAEDLPAPSDYDGDGKADLAVFRPSNGVWYIHQSTAGLRIEQFGASGDVPVPGDYDGDGKNDLAVWRPSNGVWFERRSSAGDFAIQFGASMDKVAPADYDGDRKTDVGIYRPSQGTWYSVNSSNGGISVQVFGLAGDIPVPGNYDGDVRADIAVFRPSNGTWYINQTTYGIFVTQYGATNDKPTPNAFGN